MTHSVERRDTDRNARKVEFPQDRRMRAPKDAERVAVLVAEGRSDAEIAALLGRSTAAVQKQRQRLGITCAAVRTRWSPERVDEVVSLLMEERSVEQIDDRLGLKPGSTRRWLNRLGVKTLTTSGEFIARRLLEADQSERLGQDEGHRRKTWSHKDVSALKGLASQGISDREIGGQLGRSPEAVAQKRRQLKLLLGGRGRTLVTN